MAPLSWSLCPVSSLAPHMPPRISVPCIGWSRITWKGRPLSSNHWVTAAASLPVSLLSKSREATASTSGSSSGRNLHTIPNILLRSP